MIPRIENYPHSSVSGVLSLRKPDGLFVLDVNEMRSGKTNIISWHATCRSTAVSKILDWLVQ